MPQVFIIFGPPGTGKTTTLLGKIDELLDGGFPPERIGFVSFSRRAVKEAVTRASERFGIAPGTFEWFRTIHSTAFQLSGLTRDMVLQAHHLQEFGRIHGVPFVKQRARADTEDTPILEGELGDRCMGLHQLALARETRLEDEWLRAHLLDTPWEAVQEFPKRYGQFKADLRLVDFTDMLQLPAVPMPVDVLFIDEAQDSSRLQWSFLRRVAAAVPVVFVAGDDDQAIHEWSGADPWTLTSLKGDRVVLPQSYRLPAAVKKLADRIIRNVRRVPKEFAPREENGEVVSGDVRWISDFEQVSLKGEGSWLLMARTQHLLPRLRDFARRQAVVYTLPNGEWSWNTPSVQAAFAYEELRRGRELPARAAVSLRALTHHRVLEPETDMVSWEQVFEPGKPMRTVPWFDALTRMDPGDWAYIRELRESGEMLNRPGRVRIGTVHSMKGAEADNVLLMTDITQRIHLGRQVDPDAERRVQYVGITRARAALYLMRPTSQLFWHF